MLLLKMVHAVLLRVVDSLAVDDNLLLILHVDILIGCKLPLLLFVVVLVVIMLLLVVVTVIGCCCC